MARAIVISMSQFCHQGTGKGFKVCTVGDTIRVAMHWEEKIYMLKKVCVLLCVCVCVFIYLIL